MSQMWQKRRKQRSKNPASLLGATVVSLALSPFAGVVQAQTADSAAMAEARALVFAIDSTDEGPHIFWHDDSTAYVFYLCNGETVSRIGRAAESLSFRGLCGDSTTRYSIPAAPPTIEPFVFEGVSRVFTVSDIHGEHEAFVDILKNADVIDDDLSWNWGDGHLVVLGDVFDRGDKVTESLWLIHRLEREAKVAGGRVHFLLGNHEEMVIRGDLRYVNEKYMSGIVRRSRITYDDMFGPDMQLGRWLRTKHVAVEIDKVLYVHAGLAPEVVERELSIDEINRVTRGSLDIKSYELVFSDLPWFIFSGAGPLWYRGYHGPYSGYPQITSEELDMILNFYDVAAIVVGHTEIPQVTSSYQGRVYAIDVPVKELGGLQGLLWKNGRFYRVLVSGELESFNQP